MSIFKISRCLTNRIKLMSTTISSHRNYGDIYEPDYLASMIPDIPVLGTLNIQLRGYDFPILEKFHKNVYMLADTLDIDVDDSWATPPQKLKVHKFKDNSNVVDCDYNLSIYERTVSISDAPSNIYSIFLRLIQESLPEGVTVQVQEASPEHQEVRYVPDVELMSLKQQLEGLGGPKDKKKKRF